MNTSRIKRIPVELKAEFVAGFTRHEGVIENVSRNGLCMKIIQASADIEVAPDSKLDLTFQLPTGKKMNLNCKKVWSYKITSRSLIKRIGMEIIDPPSQYKRFLTTLQ